MTETNAEVSRHLKWLDKTGERIAKNDSGFPQRVAFWQGLFAAMQAQLGEGEFIGAVARSKAISEQEAAVEPLTGLKNFRGLRTAARDLFVEAQASHQPLAIGVIDIVNLKLLNTTLGHIPTDTLLKQMAKIFAEWRMPGDVFARLHGDEFACLASDTNKEELLKVLQAVEIEIRELFVKKGLTDFDFPVGISYGAVEWNKKDSLNRVLKRADYLMYKHKNAVKTAYNG